MKKDTPIPYTEAMGVDMPYKNRSYKSSYLYRRCRHIPRETITLFFAPYLPLAIRAAHGIAYYIL